MTADSPEITQLLSQWSDGDQTALDQLTPLVYDELRRLAHSYLRHERKEHTLQTTALVHEAYIRLVDYKKIRWQKRAHFFAIAAQLMRRILVEHARARGRAKRGGNPIRIPLDEVVVVSRERIDDILALDEALHRLEELDDRKHKIVVWRCFGGLQNEEIAEVLNISVNGVIRHWKLAQAWLRRELSQVES